MKRKIGLCSAMLIGASVYAAEAPVVSGFVHGQARYTDTDRGGDKGDVNFLVHDGAVYFQHQVGGARVMLDIPFAANGSSQALALDPSGKGQAYVASSMGGINWKLGQFDTPFGYEANDSVDRVFNVDGAVANNMPVVHRGLSLGYSASEMLGLEFFVANPTTGFTGAPSANNNDKVETGLNVAAKMDNLTLNIGGMYARYKVKNHYGFFFNTKYTMNALTLGLEVDYVKDTTSIVTRTAEEWMSALHLGYAMSDVMSLGFRGEFLKHKDADVWTASVGPQFAIEKDVSLKVDYTIRRDANDYTLGTKGGTKYFTHILALGAVARF